MDTLLLNKDKVKFRKALVKHYMNAESMLPWDKDGKLPATEKIKRYCNYKTKRPPYTHKPIVNAIDPYLRPAILKSKFYCEYDN